MNEYIRAIDCRSKAKMIRNRFAVRKNLQFFIYSNNISLVTSNVHCKFFFFIFSHFYILHYKKIIFFLCYFSPVKRFTLMVIWDISGPKCDFFQILAQTIQFLTVKKF